MPKTQLKSDQHLQGCRYMNKACRRHGYGNFGVAYWLDDLTIKVEFIDVL